MTLTRRQILEMTAAAGTLALAPGAALAATGNEPMKDSAGLYTQPWFLQSFMELKDDLAEASSSGKKFAILWEQRGCPYCRELHAVNFADPEVADFIKANFTILQFDIHGPRKVTDFDGTVMSEKELAQRWRISFTPTLCFFSSDPASVEGKIGVDAEVARMPGYFKPFHFATMFAYVKGEHYKSKNFQAFLQERADKMRADGKTVVLW
jgi:thioredoxin-related protein